MADEVKMETAPLLVSGTPLLPSGSVPIEVPSSEPITPPPPEGISQYIAGVGGWTWKPELGKHEWERAVSPIPDMPKSGESVMVEDVGGWKWSPKKQMHQWEQWGVQQPIEKIQATQQATEQIRVKQPVPYRGETPSSAGYEWSEERRGWVRSSDKLMFIPRNSKPQWEQYIPSSMTENKGVREWKAKPWWEDPFYSGSNSQVKTTGKQRPIKWNGLLPPMLDGEI